MTTKQNLVTQNAIAKIKVQRVLFDVKFENNY